MEKISKAIGSLCSPIIAMKKSNIWSLNSEEYGGCEFVYKMNRINRTTVGAK